VLLGTLPGEPHGLGLLMAEALFALEGCACFPLGVQTPVLEIARAARALDIHIVALGFSASLNARQAQDRLSELRAELPAAVQLWAGGAAPGLRRRLPEGVQRLEVLEQIPFQLRASPAAN
jgi:methanogenic corrinoid protein MtbC1